VTVGSACYAESPVLSFTARWPQHSLDREPAAAALVSHHARHLSLMRHKPDARSAGSLLTSNSAILSAVDPSLNLAHYPPRRAL